MSTQSVGIREFRDKLATYLLTADKPLAITRHGDTIGFYLPVRRKRTEAERDAYRQAHARLQEILAEKGITEDDIIADLQQLKEKSRKGKEGRG
jgi:PHD/YefM family antitoxin component YafN of YafNO toxin-antitoxin module